MALYSLTTSPSSFGNSHLSFIVFSFANFHMAFCAIKPSISKLFNSLLYSSLVILFFSPSILQLFASMAGTSFLENLDSFHHFPDSLVSICSSSAAILQFWSHSVPRISRTLSAPCQKNSLPVHSSDQVMTSQMTPPPFFQSFRQDFWSITSTCHLHICATFSASHTSVPVRFRAPLCSMLHSFTPLVDKTPLFFRLWPEFLTIFPFLH